MEYIICAILLVLAIEMLVICHALVKIVAYFGIKVEEQRDDWWRGDSEETNY